MPIPFSTSIPFLLIMLAQVASAAEIVLEDFSHATHKWSTMNDPVMGGQSHSSLKIANGVAHFEGVCAIVPFLHAPGFITMETGNGYFSKPEDFPDVSSCEGLSLTLKSNVEYSGYRISFGNEHLKTGHHARGYKAPLPNVPRGEFGEVVLPFSDFSSKWNDATGDIEVSCKEDPQYCPSKKWLANMQTISFWGEGVEGTIDLEIQQIRAVGCSESIGASALLKEVHDGQSLSFAHGIIFMGCALIALAVGSFFKQQSSPLRTRDQYDEIANLEA